jgi:hypothetical protein
VVCFECDNVLLGFIKGHSDQLGSHYLSRTLCVSVQHSYEPALVEAMV